MTSTKNHKKVRVYLKPSDVVAAIKRIKKKATNKLITHIYMIVYETNISGAWSDPKEAVKSEFSHVIKEEDGVRFHFGAPLLTVEEAVEKMLEPNSDYPYLAKVKINPVDDNETWGMNR